MTDEQAQGVNTQETAVPDVEIEGQSQEQESQEATTAVVEPDKGSKDYNWRQMQKKNEDLDRQVKELMRRDDERNRPPPPKEEEELNNLADDDILTVAQARKMSETQAKQIVKKALADREKASLPDRTRSQFNDFDSIMTEENIKKLENKEPGLAAACAGAPNPWEATYKILKAFVLPTQSGKEVKGDTKLKENMSKPASSNSVGRAGPLSNANTWSEASRDELYNEMMQSSRQS